MGAEGFSDIEGKVTRVGASERGQRTSFKSLLILIKSEVTCLRTPYTKTRSSARRSSAASRDRTHKMISVLNRLTIQRFTWPQPDMCRSCCRDGLHLLFLSR